MYSITFSWGLKADITPDERSGPGLHFVGHRIMGSNVEGNRMLLRKGPLMTRHFPGYVLFAVLCAGLGATAISTAAKPIRSLEVIPGKRIGEYRIGLTRAQARRTYGTPEGRQSSISRDIYVVGRNGYEDIEVSLFDDGQRIAAVDMERGRFHLPNGLSERSSVKTVRATYRKERCVVSRERLFDSICYSLDYPDRGVAFHFLYPVGKSLQGTELPSEVTVHQKGKVWRPRWSSE